MKTLIYSLAMSMSLAPVVASAEGSDGSSAGVAIFGIGLFIIIMVFYMIFFAVAIAAFVFWIIMLVDAAQRTNWQNENDKTTWILIVALTGGIGALIYYFMVRKKLGPPHAKR